jgi:hypothetical protein
MPGADRRARLIEAAGHWPRMTEPNLKAAARPSHPARLGEPGGPAGPPARARLPASASAVPGWPSGPGAHPGGARRSALAAPRSIHRGDDSRGAYLSRSPGPGRPCHRMTPGRRAEPGPGWPSDRRRRHGLTRTLQAAAVDSEGLDTSTAAAAPGRARRRPPAAGRRWRRRAAAGRSARPMALARGLSGPAGPGSESLGPGRGSGAAGHRVA